VETAGNVLLVSLPNNRFVPRMNIIVLRERRPDLGFDTTLPFLSGKYRRIAETPGRLSFCNFFREWERQQTRRPKPTSDGVWKRNCPLQN
jgi:hypothetical protein